MKKILLLFILNSMILASSYPYRSSVINKGAFQFDFGVLYSVTSAAFDSEGTEVELEEETGYQLIDSSVRIDYGFSPNLQLGADVIFRQLESETTTDVISSSGIESFAVHAKYEGKGSRKNKYAFELSYRMTAYSNEYYLNRSDIPVSDDVNLGDDGQSILLSFLYDRVISRASHLEFSLAYHLPPNDLSAEIPYSLAYVYKGQTIAFAGGVEGIYSLGLDEFEQNPGEKPLSDFGVTSRYNSINRELMSVFGRLNLKLSNKYLLSGKVSQVMSGVSTDKATNFLVSLTYSAGGTSSSQTFENKFKEYSTEATIIKVSPRGVFFKLDKGLSSDVVKGARADIYKSDYFGENVLLGSGFIYESGPDWSIVKVVKKFKRLPIEKGYTVRIK